MDGGKAKDFLNFQVNRKVTSLYKSLSIAFSIYINEDLFLNKFFQF